MNIFEDFKGKNGCTGFTGLLCPLGVGALPRGYLLGEQKLQRGMNQAIMAPCGVGVSSDPVARGVSYTHLASLPSGLLLGYRNGKPRNTWTDFEYSYRTSGTPQCN